MASEIFSSVPVIFLSRTHFRDDELHDFEDKLEQAGARVTYDILEAGIILSKVMKRTRLLFDLKAKHITIEEQASLHDEPVPATSPVLGPQDNLPELQNDVWTRSDVIQIPDDEETASEEDDDLAARGRLPSSSPRSETIPASSPPPMLLDITSPVVELASNLTIPDSDFVTAVRIDWAHQSLKAGKALPTADFEIMSGYRTQLEGEQNVSKDTARSGKNNGQPLAPHQPAPARHKSPEQAILERAKEDASTTSAHPARSFKRKFQGPADQVPRSKDNPSWAPGSRPVQHAHLLHATTSEEAIGASSDIPEPPEWVAKGIKYACQRVTSKGSPNEEFIELLRKIKLARLLTSDEIGVRAYSTSIAALLAYPYKFISPREILRLPGCDAKIANLFVEYANTGTIKAVHDIEADHDLTILRLFYNIWGVGALTAREFYFDRGWQDLDDLVEYNWKGLSRVQQIGVKYYEEFLDPIPRAEVEHIGRVVHEHAVRVRDSDVQTMIVGGYRRGKEASGDVDIIVSHPDEDKTLGIVTDIIASLEDEDWITHTLLLSTNNTKRDQQTLPFRSGDMHGGHGFDSLDKALVVWQDRNWLTKEVDVKKDQNAKNPNIHRRVDIIIAPWRTVGCAVLGWSGGTTFQRDVRRYVKHLYGWKFDSSGVRDRGNGEVLDLEGYHRYDGKLGEGRAKTMLEAEKRVFEGLRLEYRDPSERWTD